MARMDLNFLLKVIFEKKGKTLEIANLSYMQLIHKLMHGCRLNPNNYYHLYYADYL